MNKYWMIINIAALVFGSFLAWRVSVISRSRAEYLPRFRKAICLSLIPWLSVVVMFAGSGSYGFLMTLLAIYLPILFTAQWALNKHRRKQAAQPDAAANGGDAGATR